MELEQSRALLDKNGVRVAAISYDSQEILADFARKYAIGYPLLSDRTSEVIRRFGIFNTNMAPELRSYGVPHPVEYLISPDGVVLDKYFVDNYQHRVTASAVALEQFGGRTADAPVTGLSSGALTAQIWLASGRAFAGQEVSFLARITMQPDWHIYAAHNGESSAPENHTPLSIAFDGPEILKQEVTFPEPHVMTFPLLDETLPVYDGSFEIRGRILLRFPLPEGALLLRGNLRFQQCSDNVCEPPQNLSFDLLLTLESFLVADRDRKG